jgi:hypothetical protein
MIAKPKLFISHIADEGDLAQILKDVISKAFLDLVDVFVSSDGKSITVGSKWLQDVDDALTSAKAMLILCSRESVSRPWINFEAGAGWVRGIPVVPICHTGMRPVDLPIPLNMLEGVQASDETGLRQTIELVASQLGSAVPKIDYERMIARITEFQKNYGLVRVVRGYILHLIELLPELKRVFSPRPEARNIAGPISDLTVDKMKPSLDGLQEMGMIAYSLGSNIMTFSGLGGGGGNKIETKLEVQDAYYAIADEVIG